MNIVPWSLRPTLERPRPQSPLLIVAQDILPAFLRSSLQPADVVLSVRDDEVEDLCAAGCRAYAADLDSEGLRVSFRSVAMLIAQCRDVTAEQLLRSADWIALRLVPAGLAVLTDVPYPLLYHSAVRHALWRRFDVLAGSATGWVLRLRPRVRTPAEIAEALRQRIPDEPPPVPLPPVTRPLVVTAPPSATQIAAVLDTVDLAGRMAARWAPGRPPHGVPPLPIRTGHLALQLACGDFDGAVGTGPHRHVVHGQVTRTPVATTVDGVTTTLDELRVVVTAVDATGQITTLMGGDDAHA